MNFKRWNVPNLYLNKPFIHLSFLIKQEISLLLSFPPLAQKSGSTVRQNTFWLKDPEESQNQSSHSHACNICLQFGCTALMSWEAQITD